MNEVWKYILTVGEDGGLVEMPKDAIILSAGNQDGKICVWAIVDPKVERVTRQFRVIGTGWPVTGYRGTFIGTAIMDPFVWHVFDCGEI